MLCIGRVESKGKVRWNCNVTVKKKVVDLKRVVGQKLLSTFGSLNYLEPYTQPNQIHVDEEIWLIEFFLCLW